MATTWTDLQKHIGAPDEDEDFLVTCLATATELVDAHVGDAVVPERVKDSALLEVGSKLYARRGSRGGYTMGETANTPGVIVAKDPMVTAYPLLAKYVVVGL